jgi:hypothetical protein
MSMPVVSAGIEDGRDLTRVRIAELDSIRLTEVARGTSEGEVVQLVRTAPGRRDDMLDMEFAALE